ncbi:MAG TPA: hypothetical protein VK575_11780 [Gemmatimonadaceae bacterium]|nr:hypothetical protein [Gemmatimonadaceae bacterium]
MDSRLYPQGKGAASERYINDVLVQFGMARELRQRVAAAALTTTGGLFTELPALPGVRWRLLDFIMIAIGGNATTSTSINIYGTRAAAVVELAVVAVAALTRSAVVRGGAANAVVLADGASFTQLDANTPVGYKAPGATLTVATHIDFIIKYVADPA